MCEGCWAEAGRPTALPANAAEFADLHRQLYEVEAVGGPMHSVLDDWNLVGHISPYPGASRFSSFTTPSSTIIE